MCGHGWNSEVIAEWCRIWTKAKLLSIMLWLVTDHVIIFCNLKLNYNLGVCGTPNLINYVISQLIRNILVYKSISISLSTVVLNSRDR